MVSGIRAAQVGRGGAGARVFLQSVTCSDTQTDPANASCGITLMASGLADLTGNGSTADFNWKLTGNGADYDAFFTVTSGSPTGTTGSWLNLGTDRGWGLSRPGIGSNSATGTLQIRDASTLVVLAGPVNVNMEATVDGG